MDEETVSFGRGARLHLPRGSTNTPGCRSAPEFDPTRDEVVYGCFRNPGSRTRARIDSRAEQVGTFVREQLGHGLSFSIDTEKAMSKRCEQIRKIAANS